MSRLVSILCFWALSGLALSAAGPDLLFQSGQLLELSLTAPFTTIDRERDREKEYQGTLSYTDDAGQQVSLDVDLRVRGNWRLRRDNCRYSQLWVDFKRRQVVGTLFENQNRLKLVVQCDRSNRYANYLLKEYQLYQLFSLLSEYNFDSRLLNVSYVDNSRDDRERTSLAFFFEHQNRLADRFEMDKVEASVDRANHNSLQATLVSLFMYLIGNTDYSISQASEGDGCCHNAKLLVDGGGQYFAIPYDFDASGFVDASYAPLPNPSFRISSNRQRHYRGYCVDSDTLAAAVAILQQSREQIYAIIGDTTVLSSREARKSTRYVEAFFDILDDPRRLTRNIVNDCLG